MTELINHKRGEETAETSRCWTQREQQHPAQTTVRGSLRLMRLTGVWIKKKKLCRLASLNSALTTTSAGFSVVPSIQEPGNPDISKRKYTVRCKLNSEYDSVFPLLIVLPRPTVCVDPSSLLDFSQPWPPCRTASKEISILI